jgi:NitT/TauT family transport system ATP-binding protein
MVEFEEVSLHYPGTKTATIEHLDLHVGVGEFVAVVGPSGCGKSSLMKLVTGLRPPTSGRIRVDGKDVRGPLKIAGMAFQNPTMLPWLTIRQNVMLPLKVVEPFKSKYRAQKNGEFRARADRLLAQVGLADLANSRPWQLSGGMLQRASLCRALIHEPALLLLDEPFGALDQFMREELWEVLQSLWMRSATTVILVTHDLREATFLASRVLIMNSRPGRIVKEQPIPFAYPRSVPQTYSAEFSEQMLGLREAIFHARQDKREQEGRDEVRS